MSNSKNELQPDTRSNLFLKISLAFNTFIILLNIIGFINNAYLVGNAEENTFNTYTAVFIWMPLEFLFIVFFTLISFRQIRELHGEES